jgi:hypothetical protein
MGQRIAESGTGVLVKRKDLSVGRLRSAVREARSMRVAKQAFGGPGSFAGVTEELVPELVLEAHGDLSLIR